MEFFLKWLIFASVGIAATLSPGPAFAFTVRNSIAHGRKSALIASFGLGAGVALMVVLVLTGFALLISQSVVLFNVIRYCGAAYLVYIGIKTIRAMPVKNNDAGADVPADYRLQSSKKSFLFGFFTNITNPKAIIYFTAIFAQFITPDMLPVHKIIYAATPVMTEIAWFSCVGIALTDRRLKAKFMSISHWIERVCGGLMIALGFKLALSKI